MDLDSHKFDNDDKQNVNEVMTSMHSILGKCKKAILCHSNSININNKNILSSIKECFLLNLLK